MVKGAGPDWQIGVFLGIIAFIVQVVVAVLPTIIFHAKISNFFLGLVWLFAPPLLFIIGSNIFLNRNSNKKYNFAKVAAITWGIIIFVLVVIFSEFSYI